MVLKTSSIVVVGIFVVVFGLFMVTAGDDRSDEAGTVEFKENTTQDMLDLINSKRNTNNAGQVSINDTLMKIAQNESDSSADAGIYSFSYAPETSCDRSETLDVFVPYNEDVENHGYIGDHDELAEAAVKILAEGDETRMALMLREMESIGIGVSVGEDQDVTYIFITVVLCSE